MHIICTVVVLSVWDQTGAAQSLCDENSDG